MYLNSYVKSKTKIMSGLQIGDTYEAPFAFSQEEVNAFATLTGDKNPVHIDAEYAAKTVFRRPIMHGMLAASIFSKVLGMDFPGEGTVYLKQSLEFKRPLYPSENYIGHFEIVEINKPKGLATIKTTIYDSERKRILLEGEANIRNKGAIYPDDSAIES